MSNYTTRNNQDLFYVVNSTIGDLNETYTFLKNNPTVKVSSVPIGLVVTFIKSVSVPPTVNSSKPQAPVTSKTYFSRNNQSVFDISLMTTTDYNQLYSMILSSGFTNVNAKPKAGTPFVFNPQNITDNILSKYVSNNGVIFNTSKAPDGIIPSYEKEFMDSTLFLFQDLNQYDYQN